MDDRYTDLPESITERENVMGPFNMKKTRVFSHVTAILLLLTIMVFSLTVFWIPQKVQAASKKTESVSLSEEKKIENFLDKYTSMYFEQCRATLLSEKNPQVFYLNKTRKTDMAIMALDPYSSLKNVEVAYSDSLWHKYNPYNGLWTFSKGVKNKITKSGKKLFGKSFELVFAQDNPHNDMNDRNFYIFPLSSDKKYIVNNDVDWGACNVEHKYLSAEKKSGVYIVKVKYSCVEEDESGKNTDSTIFTVKLKKKGSSYIITDIKCS